MAIQFGQSLASQCFQFVCPSALDRPKSSTLWRLCRVPIRTVSRSFPHWVAISIWKYSVVVLMLRSYQHGNPVRMEVKESLSSSKDFIEITDEAEMQLAKNLYEEFAEHRKNDPPQASTPPRRRFGFHKAVRSDSKSLGLHEVDDVLRSGTMASAAQLLGQILTRIDRNRC